MDRPTCSNCELDPAKRGECIRTFAVVAGRATQATRMAESFTFSGEHEFALQLNFLFREAFKRELAERVTEIGCELEVADSQARFQKGINVRM